MAKEPPCRLGLVFEDYGLQVELKATALLILEVLLSRMSLKQVRYELLGKKPLDREPDLKNLDVSIGESEVLQFIYLKILWKFTESQ
ncbi:hypothetical protein VNO77_23456 [Canavalia gladiata]|uniref:Uncharacterized protein n=1 Tax=Canavalia gladiata TaxID=3824 RepID=A0AAN9QBI7_CANGL